MQKLLFVVLVASVVVAVALLVVLRSDTSAPGTESVQTFPVVEQQGGLDSTETHSTVVDVPTEDVRETIVVQAFSDAQRRKLVEYALPLRSNPHASDGLYSVIETRDYRISYNEHIDFVHIAVLSEPVYDVRAEAERFLAEKLKVDVDALCQYHIRVTVSPERGLPYNPTYGLSCS